MTSDLDPLDRAADWRIPDWVTADDFVAEGERAAERLVLVTAARADAGSRQAVERALSIPARERRALHVVVDDAVAHSLTRAWSEEEWPVPLHLVEDDGGVAASVARVVRFELAAGFDEVVVLVGRRLFVHPVARLRHHTADAIGRAVSDIPAALPGILGVPTGG